MKPIATLSALFAATAALAHGTLLVAAATKEGETITIGSTVFEIDLGGGVTAGRVAVVLTSNAVAASGTLTLVANPTANDTVTIGAKTYTFKASVTTTANEVKIGATASDSLDNLIAAITGGAGAGTLYGSATVASTQVTAAAGAGDTMTVTALVRGTGGNSIGTTETLTNAGNVFGAATLASGADPSAANSITGIVSAINANMEKCRATAITGGILFVDYRERGTVATTETLTGSGNAWQNATTIGVDAGGAIPNLSGIVQRTVTAGEDSGKVFTVALPVAPVAFIVQVRASTGALKAWDGKAVIVGQNIVLYSDGSTDLVENDVVAVTFAV